MLPHSNCAIGVAYGGTQKIYTCQRCTCLRCTCMLEAREGSYSLQLC